MKILCKLIVCFIILGCKQDAPKTFLQKNTIALAQPRVWASKTFIDSFVTIQAHLKVKDVAIYYTENGDEPSVTSKEYKAPIQVSNPGIYKFKAFHKDWKPSEVTKVELFKKGISAQTILWHTKASEKYSGRGAETLINQTKASLNFTDKEWVGFDSVALATVDFKEKTFLKSLKISYLNDVGSWIFPPERVTLFINDFKKEIPITPLEKAVDKTNETVIIPIEAEVKSLKIQIDNLQSIPEWHEGKGQNAWLFMDEFIFN